MRTAVMITVHGDPHVAQVLCDTGTQVALCSRRADLVAAINYEAPELHFLQGITLRPAALTASAETWPGCWTGADLVVLAVWARTLRHHLGA